MIICEICNNRATNRFVLGHILTDKYLDLCLNCSYIYEHTTPKHIPDEQVVKYLKAKINGK